MAGNIANNAACNDINAAVKNNTKAQADINKQFDKLYADQHKVMTSSLPAAQKEAKMNALIAKGELLAGQQAHANLNSAKLERQAEKAGCDRL